MAGALCPRGKDQEDRGNRRRLPPDKQRQQITGMKRGDGGTGIGDAGGMIGDAAFMPAIEDVQRRRDMENDGKGKAEMIGASMKIWRT
jgi:hypothetical protein